MVTFSPKQSDITRAWHLIDADGLVLGRLATEAATLLRGKHKPTFAPYIDTGDHVVIINASKVVLTSDKIDKKVQYRHSGYPGGLKTRGFRELLEKEPEKVVERAIKGMLPKGRLGREMIQKLKVYSGHDHPHLAQNPQPHEVAHARRARAEA